MTEISFDALGVREKFEIKDISPIHDSIFPRLRLQTEIMQFSNNPQTGIFMHNFMGLIYLRPTSKTGNPVFIGDLTSETLGITIFNNGSNRFYSHLTIDYYRLAIIEKLRENSDINFRVSFKFLYHEKTSAITSEYSFEEEYKIAKSDWVERFLPAMNYKQVFLLEAPKLSNGDFSGAINHLENAWKMLSMGEYPNVLTSCQKALEESKSVLKAKEFIDAKGDIDFGKMTNSDTIKDSLNTIIKKIYAFYQPGGRHSGRSINKEDAEFAIMVTHGLINLMVKNVS